MLTGDLVRARVKGKTITPSLVEPSRKALREGAETLVDTARTALEEQWSRGDFDEAVADLTATRRDHKILKGFAKLIADRSEFEVVSPLPPMELRDRVFRLARERGPLALTAGPLDRPTAEDVVSEVASELGVEPDQVRRALYANLAEHQQLTRCRVPDAEWLVNRYNVALVQALLLKALEVKIRLEKASVPRLRQLFRHVKFHQLMSHAVLKGKTLHLTLDGPTSMFKKSTKYGMQLANFFPALLLQEVPWTMTATILWTRARHRKTMTLSHEDGLVSHYRDTGAYETQEQTWFADRWAKQESDWTMIPGKAPIQLGPKAVILPDFTFEKDGKTAHLEIVGFWRKEWLKRRVEILAEWGPGNLVLAVSRKLRGSKEALDEIEGLEVIEFANIVPPKDVLEAVERIAPVTEIELFDTVPHPRPEVYSAHRDRLLELVPYMDNVSEVRLRREARQGDVVIQDHIWTGTASELPMALRPFVRPELLVWHMHSTWQASTCHWSIYLPALPELVTCQGDNVYHAVEEGTRIEMEAVLVVHAKRAPDVLGVPELVASALGPVVERFVLGLVRQNLLSASHAIEELLRPDLDP